MGVCLAADLVDGKALNMHTSQRREERSPPDEEVSDEEVSDEEVSDEEVSLASENVRF
jgi:hypothetical protein